MNVNVSKDVMLFNSLPGFRTKQALNLSSFLKWNTKRMWEGFLMSRDALVVGINTYNHLQNLKSPARDAEAVAQSSEIPV